MSVNVSHHICPIQSCSSTVSSKNALKKHLQSHFTQRDPDLSPDLLKSAGFTPCSVCSHILVTIKRGHCQSCKTTAESNEPTAASNDEPSLGKSQHSITESQSLLSKSDNTLVTTQGRAVDLDHSTVNDIQKPTAVFPNIHEPAAIVYPSLKNLPTLVHVPKAARRSWANILATVLKEAYQKNSLENWTRLFMLAKCVLDLKPSVKVVTTHKHRNNNANKIITACKRWAAGDVLGLWNEAVSSKNSHHNSKQKRASNEFCRAKRLASEGRYSDACASLLAEPLAPLNEETYQKLQMKHPQGPTIHLPHTNIPDPLEINSKIVVAQLKRFPKGSAPCRFISSQCSTHTGCNTSWRNDCC